MKILLAIPTLTQVHYKLVPWIVKMCMSTEHKVTLMMSSMVGNEANRGVINKKFLAGDWDYLLMIDSDQEPLANPLDMIKHDKDVVSMPTVFDAGENDIFMVWNVFDELKDEGDKKYRNKARVDRGTGLEKAFAIGTGCILIKRKVLEAVKNPFAPIRDKNDARLSGQDITFCRKCRDLGFEVWIDWDRITRHFKEIDLLLIP